MTRLFPEKVDNQLKLVLDRWFRPYRRHIGLKR